MNSTQMVRHWANKLLPGLAHWNPTVFGAKQKTNVGTY